MFIVGGRMVLSQKLLFKGANNSSKIAIVRMANGNNVNVDSLTMPDINRYSLWKNKWHIKIDQH